MDLLHNKLQIIGDNEKVAEVLQSIAGIDINGDPCTIDFNKIIPAPEGKKESSEWCYSNWGPKWNADASIDQRNTEDTIYFGTINELPYPVIKELSKLHPDLQFKLMSDIPGFTDLQAEAVFQNDQRISYHEKNIQTGEDVIGLLVDDEDSVTSGSLEGQTFVSAQDLLNMKIVETPKLLSPILPKVGIACLAGTSDGGKSFLCQNLVMDVCSDSPTSLGYDLNVKHGQAIYVCTEDSKEDVASRLHHLSKYRQWYPEKLNFVFDADKSLHLVLKKKLAEFPVDIVIVDTFGDLFTSNLNDSISVRTFLRPYKLLAKKFECLILFNHHIGKGKESNLVPSKNDVLGSQAIESASRTVLMLQKKGDGKRVLTVVKANHLSDEHKQKGKVYLLHNEKGFTPTGEEVSIKEECDCSDEDLLKHIKELYPKLGNVHKVADELKKVGCPGDKNKVASIVKEHSIKKEEKPDKEKKKSK